MTRIKTISLITILAMGFTSSALAFGKRPRNGGTLGSESQKSKLKSGHPGQIDTTLDANLVRPESAQPESIYNPPTVEAYPSRIVGLLVTSDLVVKKDTGHTMLGEHCMLIHFSAPDDMLLRGAVLKISKVISRVRSFETTPVHLPVGLVIAESSLLTGIACRPGRTEIVVPLDRALPQGAEPASRYAYITNDQDIAQYLDGIMTLQLRP